MGSFAPEGQGEGCARGVQGVCVEERREDYQGKEDAGVPEGQQKVLGGEERNLTTILFIGH